VCILHETHYLSGRIDVTRFNRRLHKLADWLAFIATTLRINPAAECAAGSGVRSQVIGRASAQGWRGGHRVGQTQLARWPALALRERRAPLRPKRPPYSEIGFQQKHEMIERMGQYVLQCHLFRRPEGSTARHHAGPYRL